jgi:hypothetical protein
VRLLSASGLEAVWSISDAMGGDGVEQLLVQDGAERVVAVPLKVEQRSKRLQCLQRSFEADRALLDASLGGISPSCTA